MQKADFSSGERGVSRGGEAGTLEPWGNKHINCGLTFKGVEEWGWGEVGGGGRYKSQRLCDVRVWSLDFLPEVHGDEVLRKGCQDQSRY